ncbi:MAG TPA: N-acetylmuramoyl-L-alanine amidase, partial [Pseudonocardiaceae bacterium]|nr:N-acetylmuramoyl-L-alanine amidase [Pseudonocardiaceae bacterium]
PNEAVITLEIEGYAKDGPNTKQHDALERLVSDVRSRYPNIGLLGHRDFQDYKACPGSHIQWDRLGGHGPYQAEDEEEMKPFPVGVDPKLADIKVGAQLYNLDLSTTDAPKVSNANGARTFYSYRTNNVTYRLVEVPTNGTPHLWLVNVADCTLHPVPDDGNTPQGDAVTLAPGLYEVKP